MRAKLCKLSCMLGSLSKTVVQAGSKVLNHSKLYPLDLVPSVKLRSPSLYKDNIYFLHRHVDEIAATAQWHKPCSN